MCCVRLSWTACGVRCLTVFMCCNVFEHVAPCAMSVLGLQAKISARITSVGSRRNAISI